MSKKGDSRLKNVLHSSDALASALNSVERELNITAKDAASGQYSQIPNDVYRARYSLKSAYDQADDIDENVRATLGVAPRRRRNFKVERDYSFTPAAIQDPNKQVLIPYGSSKMTAAKKAAEKAAAADSIPAAIENENIVENAINAVSQTFHEPMRDEFSFDVEPIEDVVQDILQPSTASLTASEARPADDTPKPVPIKAQGRNVRGKGKDTLLKEQLANVHVPIANPGESILDVAREAITGRPATASATSAAADDEWTTVKGKKDKEKEKETSTAARTNSSGRLIDASGKFVKKGK